MTPRRAAWLLGALAAAAATAAACAPKNNGTLLVARVDTDLNVPAEIDRIDVAVAVEGGAPMMSDSFPVTGRAALPITVGVRPSGDPGFAIDVTARGMLGTTVVVSQTATVRFVPGAARELTLLLARECAQAAACPMQRICVAGRGCVGKTEVATLRPYTGGGGNGDAGTNDGGGGGGSDAVDARREGRENTGTWVRSSPIAPAASLLSVWPFEDGDVWAVGNMAQQGVAYRLDVQGNFLGATLPQGTAALYGLWASAPDDVWAVGQAGMILRFDGTSWTRVAQIAGPGPTPPTLTGVWGSGPNDVWAVGAGGVIVHGGVSATFARSESGVTANLVGVWGVAANEVWAVGAEGTVLRYQGNGWAAQDHGPQANALNSVWLGSARDVWVVGLGLTLHYDGSAWSAADNPVAGAFGVWGSATDEVWTVGAPFGGTGTSYISRWNGVQWVNADGPTSVQLNCVRGSSPTNVWAAGNGGTVLRFQAP